MRALSPPELLDAWERGLHEPPATRTLPLLAACGGTSTMDEAAALSVGERDHRLLALRERTFGSRLSSVSACPECRERLEWTIEASALRAAAPQTPGDLSIESGAYVVRFRLPNTLDLAEAARCVTIAEARRLLLERCIVEAAEQGETRSAADVPAEMTDAIATAMAERDRGAGAEFDLHCPVCGHRWTLLFDIEAFFWSELSAWVPRLLKEVHTLASAYGWSEADILRMGDWRRQFYLTLIGA